MNTPAMLDITRAYLYNLLIQSKRSLFGVAVSWPSTFAGACEGVQGRSDVAASAACGSRSEAERLKARKAFLNIFVYFV